MSGDIASRTGRSATPVPAPSSAVELQTPEQQIAIAYGHSLEVKMQAARQLATATLLPRQYQNQAGNVFWAMEYGQALGISPIAVMLGIWVTPDGKPAAGSQMMQALVRSKGHKLRLSAASDGKSATCTIIRKDDPDFPTVVTYTWDMAVIAGLVGKKNWKENPVAMLKARAAAMCCRDACSEVLLGMYTPDELGADVPDDALPSDDGPYGPHSPAAPFEEGPESPAHPERIKAVVVRLKSRPYRLTTDQVMEAVRTIIEPTRDTPVADPPDLTVEECQFIMDELDKLPTLETLQEYLSPATDIHDAELVPESEGEAAADDTADDHG